MRCGYVRRRLRHGPLRLLVTGAILLPSFAWLTAVVVCGLVSGELKAKAGERVGFVLLCVAGLALALGMLWRAARGLLHLGEHPDLVALRRYGPPDAVLTDIDAEVYGKPRPLRLGTLLRFYNPIPAPGDLRGHQVLLTASWLIHLWGEGGHRVEVVCLEDLVAAFRDRSVKREQIESRLILLDRHNVRVVVPGTTAGVRRLLAEVQARAPWALGFEQGLERAWNADPAKVVAEVAERREAIRRADLQRAAPRSD